MRPIKTILKPLFYVLSISSIAYLGVFLSSCSGSSTTTSTAKPGSWDRIGDFGGSKRSSAASFTIGDKVYLIGGFDATNTRVNDAWQFAADKNSWIQKTDFPGTLRAGAVGFTIGAKGYVGAGQAINSVYLKDFWEFDPTGAGGLGTWKKIKDFGGSAEKGRNGAIAFTVANRGFVGAGFNGLNELNDIWEYMPDGDTWVQRVSLASKRVNSFAFTVDNYAYVGGGSNNGVSVKTIEQYDPSNDVWNGKLPLTQKDKTGATIVQPISRDFASTFTIGSFGYITSGSVNGQPFSDTWQYNPSSDTWIQYYSYSTSTDNGRPRDAAIGFAIGNFGYLTTGRSGSTRFDDTWKFDPDGVEDNNQ